MGESWLSGVAWGSWALAVAIYVFGIASGWLIWGGRRSVSDGDESPAAADSEQKKSAALAPATLSALENEIRKAREVLEKSDEEAEEFSEDLSLLDQAVKRANGRLKLVLRAVQRAASGR